MDTKATNVAFVSGLLAALIVAVVTTGLTATSERNEALRKERRSAYARFIGSAYSCLGYVDLESVEVFTALAADKGKADYDAVTEIAELKDCSVPLQAARGEVSILADNNDIRLQAETVTSAVFKAALAAAVPDTVEGKRYDDRTATRELTLALVDFEEMARASVNTQVLSPFVVSTSGMLVVGLLLLAYVTRLLMRK